MALNKFNHFKACLKNLKYARSVSTSSTLFNESFNKLSYEHNQFSSKLDITGMTVGQKLAEQAAAKPNDLAYKFCMTQASYTFLELKQRVDELAQNLLNLGFTKGNLKTWNYTFKVIKLLRENILGDHIALLLPNTPEAALITLAAGSIGVVTILMNPAYQLVEIEYMLKKTKAKGIFMLENLKTLQHYDLLSRICPELESSRKGELNSEKLPDLKHVIITNLLPSKEFESKYKGTWSFNEVKQHNSVSLEVPYVDFDDNFGMMFTSGSTGFPKVKFNTQ